jgi:hypothetical protein
MALMESKVRKTGLKCYVRGHLSLTARERPRASRGIIKRAHGPHRRPLAGWPSAGAAPGPGGAFRLNPSWRTSTPAEAPIRFTA